MIVKNQPKLWITYAWENNAKGNFDFLVNELKRVGVNVTFDKVALIPGRRLWEQIAARIEDPNLDGWAILLTKESLESEACKEELAYALDRALHSKGTSFPLLGLIHQVNVKDLPTALRTRLLVDLKDMNWPQQVLAGLKQVPPQPAVTTNSKYIWEVSNFEGDPRKLAVWVRPRFGDLTNWRFIFPAIAKQLGWNFGLPQNGLGGVLHSVIKGQSATLTINQNQYDVLIEGAGDLISPSLGCFIVFEEPFPEFVGFGVSRALTDLPEMDTIETIPISKR